MRFCQKLQQNLREPLNINRLGKMSVHACLQSQPDILIKGVGGHRNDRQSFYIGALQLTNLPGRFLTV